MTLLPSCDILVVGGGNAGYSAAIAARQAGAQHVVLIDKCPEDWAGGNTYFTAGAYRTVHGGLDDLLPLVNNVDEKIAQLIDLEPYTEEDFRSDVDRICSGRSDVALSTALIQDSNAAIKWLASIGVRFQLSFNRQAYRLDGRHKFWGGLTLKTEDGGKGLVEDHRRAAQHFGVEVHYSTALLRLLADPRASASASGRMHTAKVLHHDQEHTITAGAIILAGGGFESNPQMRAQFLGPSWDVAKVRGTPYNTGEVLHIAIHDALAQPSGNWSGCHSVAWDANAAADTGDRVASNEFTKSGYPLGLMVNVNGDRFVDEGVDLRNYTYAKFGRAILEQPESTAFQVWDARTTPWLRPEEYREERVQLITASTIEDLAKACAEHGLQQPNNFLRTVKAYNQAVYAHRSENPGVEWNPAIRDGLSTQSSTQQLALPKSNWALPLDEAPFVAVKVTCGITFTFGGLKIDSKTAQVVSSATGQGIPGLYCAGEMVGGLFYQNYPGGSGLTSGTVFGRRAARAAVASLDIRTQSRL
ncbi:hypothetical protein IFR05_016666 [Cadophora sp. M221]|nr:hypothetical protein IFR05_016666 [Cadophora sp. M221]